MTCSAIAAVDLWMSQVHGHFNARKRSTKANIFSFPVDRPAALVRPESKDHPIQFQTTRTRTTQLREAVIVAGICSVGIDISL
jgi:hypothetical protein